MKQETRELDLKRKKDKDELEKLKQEEMLKIKKEKKVLEQRAKNLQITTNQKPAGNSELAFLQKQLKTAQ